MAFSRIQILAFKRRNCFLHMVTTTKPQYHCSKIQLQVYTLLNISQLGSSIMSLKKKKDTMLINLIAFIEEKQMLK